jgi:hypothetical protein
MLISMPTDTSTIFGVFQAILALLAKPDEIRPTIKVTPNEKFASEIFFGKSVSFYVAVQDKLAIPRQSDVGSTGSNLFIPTGRCRGVDMAWRVPNK